MIYASQYQYDNATPPDASDYRDDSEFAEFVEYVAHELLEGNDYKNLSSEIFTIDLELLGGDHEMALEWVCERVTEKQYREWLGNELD